MKDKDQYGKLFTIKRSALRRKLILIEGLMEKAKKIPDNHEVIDNLRKEANSVIDEYNAISETKIERKHTRKLRIENG